MSRKWLAILNPTSGAGRGERDRERITRALRRAGVEFDLEVSAHAGHALSLAQGAAASGYHRFLAIGGDGTLNEVLNGALAGTQADPAELTLGLVPVGRGNDWARGRRLPHRYGAVAQLIATGSTIAHDVGVIEHFSDNKQALRYFLNVAGAGFDAHVVGHIQGKRLGALTYLAAMPASFASYQPPVLTIAANGESRTETVFVIFAAIGRYCGGGMYIAPEALPADGKFDVVVVAGISKWELILNIRRLFDGSIGGYRKVSTFRADVLELAGPVPVATEADGELLLPTPARLAMLSQRIRVVAP